MNSVFTLEVTIRCYRRAVQVHTPETHPHEWARVQMKTDDAFRIRMRGERADSLRYAIACYCDALRVFTAETMPRESASVEHNLQVV
jgi:hypothetical protein